MDQNSSNSGYCVDYGCGYLVWLSIVVVALIVVNGAVVDSLLQRWYWDRPDWMEDTRMVAAIRTVAPFLLLVFEYWVFDFIADRWRRGSHRFR